MPLQGAHLVPAVCPKCGADLQIPDDLLRVHHGQLPGSVDGNMLIRRPVIATHNSVCTSVACGNTSDKNDNHPIRNILALTLLIVTISSWALVSQAGDTLELRNSYNITGIRSPEDPLDWDPIERTPLLAINVFRDRLDIWNMTSEKQIERFYTDRLIRDVVCSPDSRYIAIAGSRNETNRQTLAVYDITTWADTYTGDDTPSEWSTVGDWSSDGQRFALGSRNGLIYVYDTSD